MRKRLLLPVLAIATLGGGCLGNDDTRQRPTGSFSIAVNPVATITLIGIDTLSDSARIHEVEPEPDGRSLAFVFADPAKGITQGLGIVQITGGQQAQLGWPDSVISVWWSNPHQLSFIAGTGRGVRVVADAHAAELRTVEATGAGSVSPESGRAVRTTSQGAARVRAQAFIDSIRVQPGGTPQHSVLRYEADSVLMGPGDTLAAVHVSAGDPQGGKVNPAWYLVHLPSGHVRPVDSLIGRSPGLAASAGQWGPDGAFYFAKEKSISRVQPTVR